MAKFEEPFEDTKKIFKDIIDVTELNRYINIKLLTNNRLKEIGKIVKVNEMYNHMTGEDIIVLINEEVFEQLGEANQLVVADSLIAHIVFDSEKDKVIISKPDVIGHSGVIGKYGSEVYLNTVKLIKEVFAQKRELKEEEDV